LSKPKNLKEMMFLVIATWFGSSLIPPPKFVRGFAGTYGTFFSLPFCYLVVTISSEYFFIFTDNKSFFHIGLGLIIFLLTSLFIFILGLLVIEDAERIIGPSTDWQGKVRSHDLNQIVIDETLGMLITCFPMVIFDLKSIDIPIIFWYILAFILFRFFDIFKIWPACYFDATPTPMNIMLDDVVAGVYAGLVLCFAISPFF